MSKKPMTDREYCLADGVVCPFCRCGDQVEGESVDIDAGEATQSCHCNECGKSWIDCYKLTGYIPTGG